VEPAVEKMPSIETDVTERASIWRISIDITIKANKTAKKKVIPFGLREKLFAAKKYTQANKAFMKLYAIKWVKSAEKFC